MTAASQGNEGTQPEQVEFVIFFTSAAKSIVIFGHEVAFRKKITRKPPIFPGMVYAERLGVKRGESYDDRNSRKIVVVFL
jgi:hypothetical protein